MSIINSPNIISVKKKAYHSFKFSKKIIIEEFLKGKTYSIDCIVLKNKIKLISTSENTHISKNKIDNFCVSQPAKLDKRITNLIQSLIKKIFRKFNSYKGPITIDFIISNKKIYFLEISPHFHSASSEILRGNGNPLVDYIKFLKSNKILNFKRKTKKIITIIKKFKINRTSEIEILLNKNIQLKKKLIFMNFIYPIITKTILNY